MHIFQPKTPTELKKFRKVEMKKQIVNWLITNGSIDTTERELYEYAIDSLKILIVPVVYAVFWGWFLQEWTITFCFVFTFSLILIFGGVKLIKILEVGIAMGIVFLSSVVFLLKNSPVDSENRRLDVDEKNTNKKRVLVVQLIASIGVVFLWKLNFDCYVKSIVVANFLAALFQGIGIIVNK